METPFYTRKKEKIPLIGIWLSNEIDRQFIKLALIASHLMDVVCPYEYIGTVRLMYTQSSPVDDWSTEIETPSVVLELKAHRTDMYRVRQ
jgi:hypothetical protein